VLRPGEVARYTGGVYSIYFSAQVGGNPLELDLDALAVEPATGDLLISFDRDGVLGGVVAADEDLLRISGEQVSLAFDGSEHGLDTALDLDGVATLASGNWLFTFDAAGKIGAVAFADEDLVEFNPVAATFELALTSGSHDAAWAAADLNALDAAATPGSWAEVLFAPAASAVAEIASFVELDVVRLGSAAGELRVQWTTEDGTALAGVDYLDASGEIVWADGDLMPRTVQVALIDDDDLDPSRVFYLRLTGISGPGVLTGPLATLTILDDESGEIAIVEIPAMDSTGLVLFALLLALAGIRIPGVGLGSRRSAALPSTGGRDGVR
ncbi:MAG: hypothetical protein K8H90_07370, partial [Thermoanaerobaculia bacterium]|nr:hypothetical protein [Thermoanaerobaculia bacterium]